MTTGDMSGETMSGHTRRSRTQAAFDHIGARYDSAFPPKDAQIAAVARLLDRLEPGARVLDVGCGTGLPTARQVADTGREVVGIDISDVMVDLARRNVPQGRFLQRDLFEIGATLGRFDAVVALFSLNLLPRAEVERALATIRDLVPPGGWLLLGMVECDLDDAPMPFLGAQVRVTGYPREELSKLVSFEGFGVEAVDDACYPYPDPGIRPEVQIFHFCRRQIT